jgi:hypothetical protein
MRFPELLILVLGTVILLVPLLFMRYRQQGLMHAERMAALEKGVPAPAWPARPSRVYLLRGLIWTFSGAALVICLLGLALASQRPESAEDRLYHASMLSQRTGISMSEAAQVLDKDGGRHQGPPVTVAMIGLIPLGVGLAYLVFYYSDPERNGATGGATPS